MFRHDRWRCDPSPHRCSEPWRGGTAGRISSCVRKPHSWPDPFLHGQSARSVLGSGTSCPVRPRFEPNRCASCDRHARSAGSSGGAEPDPAAGQASPSNPGRRRPPAEDCSHSAGAPVASAVVDANGRARGSSSPKTHQLPHGVRIRSSVSSLHVPSSAAAHRSSARP